MCSCASSISTPPSFLNARDLEVETKPALTIDALTSEAAGVENDIAVEAWGERGWLTVGRICRSAVKAGMKLAFACPPPPKE